ncbi:MAG: hypothetical protein J7J07_05465, partial [Syntrophobacterales bacterium]|nr:hypothetical protein [Syntrophobacterales bacterium]
FVKVTFHYNAVKRHSGAFYKTINKNSLKSLSSTTAFFAQMLMSGVRDLQCFYNMSHRAKSPMGDRCLLLIPYT